MEKDPAYKAKLITRASIRQAIKRAGYTKDTKTEQILGCKYAEFKTYIEKQFISGMTWSNHGLWHVDHKIPLAIAKTKDKVLELNHYTNLQPLWAKDNMSKGAQI